MDPIITIENLHKRFGKTEAICGLDLRVDAGGVLAFLGPNGAGKTSTIKTMLNMLRPDKGRIRLHESVEDLQARFRGIAVTAAVDFADFRVPEAWHNVEISGRMLRATVANFADAAAIRAQFADSATLTQLSCECMSLREIFIALARTYRLESAA
jgi:ABC-type Mn2+/Zn2+ transport system ATPase subunit